MMIDKRCRWKWCRTAKEIHCGECGAHVVLLVANIVMMSGIALLLQKLFKNRGQPGHRSLCRSCGSSQCGALFLLTTGAARMSYLSARAVKKTLREQIYQKLLKLGMSYREELKTSEIVQVAVGELQLETYFSVSAAVFLCDGSAAHALFRAAAGKCSGGGAFVCLRAAHPGCDRARPDLGKEAAVQILGSVHGARRYISGKSGGSPR